MAKNINTKKRTWPQLAFIALSILGAILSVKLLTLHVEVHTDPDYKSLCAINEKINCETVAESSQAIFMQVPVAAWGLMFFSLLLGASLIGLKPQQKEAMTGAVFTLSAVSVPICIYLVIIAYFVICSICLYCSGVYLICTIILGINLYLILSEKLNILTLIKNFFIWVIKNPWSFATPLVLCVLLYFFYPKYWEHSVRNCNKTTQGITSEGHHWIGSKNPKLIINEFSDYECPHCERAHFNVRKIIEDNKKKTQHTHRHYPLDDSCNRKVPRPFHRLACVLSRAAHCAGKQNKFWEMNDWLFQNRGKINNDAIIEQAKNLDLDVNKFLSCLESTDAQIAIKIDIEEGIGFGVSGTPAFLINNELYSGSIPPNIIENALK